MTTMTKNEQTAARLSLEVSQEAMLGMVRKFYREGFGDKDKLVEAADYIKKAYALLIETVPGEVQEHG